MRNILLCFCFALTSEALYASTPVERLILINDLETWLNNGPSYFDWSSYRDKEVNILSDVKQPVQIYMNFKRNSIAAEEKYKTLQRVSGHISNIEKNDEGEPLIVFNVGNFDRVFVNGLTRNEVIKLKVPDKVNLLCIGFKMDRSGDISATCSMFADPLRFVAVNNVQYLDKNNKLNLNHNNKEEYLKKLKILSNKINPKFNQDCAVIDSINYSACISLLNESFK